MKSILASLLACLTATAAFAAESATCPGACASEKSAGAACCQDKSAAACCSTQGAAATPLAADSIKRHPLRGLITNVYPDRSALLVKHEEIPGVMRAMTMLFKVDAATLKAAQKGQTITGLMSRQGTDWVLENVKVVSGR